MGEVPWYFGYFIHSCRYNPSVDFVVVGDVLIDSTNLPENVQVLRKNSEELQELILNKTGIRCDISHPYKLCDFKPAYGMLFNDIVKGYDFWAHGDIDVIYGDIRSFITEDLLSNKDLICVRHDFLTGYFLLFRNNDKMNRLFTLSKDYKKVFSSDRHFCFDETNFQFHAFSENTPLSEINSEIESMMHVVKKAEMKGYIRTFFDFMVIEGLPGRLRWADGKLYYKNTYEVLLYHMILFKKVYTPRMPVREIPSEFLISPTRIYHRQSRAADVN